MILSDLINLIADLSSSESIIGKKIGELSTGMSAMKSVKGRNSIKNRTRDLILQYPILTSNSISADTVQTVARALEHEYVNVLTVLLNSEIQHVIENDADADTATYLKKYHTNIYRTDGLLGESAIKAQLTKANHELLESYDNSLNLENLNSLSFPNSILIEAEIKRAKRSIGDIYKKQNDPRRRAKQAEQRARDAERRTSDAERRVRDAERKTAELERERQAYERNLSQKDKEFERERQAYERNLSQKDKESERERQAYERNLSQKDKESERERQAYERKISKNKQDYERELNNIKRYSGGGAVIDKVESKKLNDMTPTMVKSVIKIKDDKSNAIYDKQITFGVKGVIHPLESEDCIYYLSDSVRDTNKFFRLIQWTTGEIKFFRDLIASVDTVKKTALTSTEKNTFWWRKLSSMAKDNLLRRLFGKKGEPIPTATLVISKQDVDSIKNKNGIDLLNDVRHISNIMKKFFLLGFVIVDESTQIAYIYNEVSRDFDYYTFSALKDFGKENTTDMDVAKSLMRGR